MPHNNSPSWDVTGLDKSQNLRMASLNGSSTFEKTLYSEQARDHGFRQVAAHVQPERSSTIAELPLQPV